ncbi:MAG: SMC-Scp complex subunit ScpB [Desulfobacteraceae bacterium]|nr:SMC-Scp complex subunit ScpB [Desulfobacteraceae bacterium]
MEDVKSIIESLLFVSKEPLSVERIKNVLTFADTKEIRNALKSLMEEYEARKGGFYLCEVAGGYQIRTRPENKEWVKRLLRTNPPRMSKPALETLAIISWYQPITRNDIERIRAVDCGGVLRMLIERKLIRVLGRKEIPGRPLIYGTTRHFLEVFDLKDLKELPTPKEVEGLEVSSEKTDGDVPKDAAEQGDEQYDEKDKLLSDILEHVDNDRLIKQPDSPENTDTDEGMDKSPAEARVSAEPVGEEMNQPDTDDPEHVDIDEKINASSSDISERLDFDEKINIPPSEHVDFKEGINISPSDVSENIATDEESKDLSSDALENFDSDE